MSKEFILQTVEGLNLNIFDISGNQQFYQKMGLTIYCQSQLELFNRKCVLAIIGESHFLWLDGVMMELLACVNLEKKQEGVQLVYHLKGLELTNVIKESRIKNLTHCIRVKFSPYNQANNEFELPAKPLVMLEEDFPFEKDGIQYECRTIVSICYPHPNFAVLTTRHDYPYPDNKSVYTMSTFTWE